MGPSLLPLPVVSMRYLQPGSQTSHSEAQGSRRPRGKLLVLGRMGLSTGPAPLPPKQSQANSDAERSIDPSLHGRTVKECVAIFNPHATPVPSASERSEPLREMGGGIFQMDVSSVAQI